MAGASIPSKSELLEYTAQHPVWAAEQRLPGLESLLSGAADPRSAAGPPLRRAASERGASPERRSPFLLGDGMPAGGGFGPGAGGAGPSSSGGGLGSSLGGAAAGYQLPSSIAFPPSGKRVAAGGPAAHPFGGSAFGGDW